MKAFLYLSTMLLMASGVYAQEAKTAQPELTTLHASLSGKLGEVTRADILKSPEVTVDGNKNVVTEFKLSIAGKDIPYVEFQGHGSKLDGNMINHIKSAPPHATLIFEFVRYTNETGKLFLARPFKIELK